MKNIRLVVSVLNFFQTLLQVKEDDSDGLLNDMLLYINGEAASEVLFEGLPDRLAKTLDWYRSRLRETMAAPPVFLQPKPIPSSNRSNSPAKPTDLPEQEGYE